MQQPGRLTRLQLDGPGASALHFSPSATTPQPWTLHGDCG